MNLRAGVSVIAGEGNVGEGGGEGWGSERRKEKEEKRPEAHRLLNSSMQEAFMLDIYVGIRLMFGVSSNCTYYIVHPKMDILKSRCKWQQNKVNNGRAEAQNE